MVESVEHALPVFFWEGRRELRDCREWLAESVHASGMQQRCSTLIDAVCQVAKMAHRVFKVFAEEPMVWPDGA
ncbi:hypothetical protein R3P38DRAFT_3390928 [Favolaschia claudopus]|uniref:Uncharacterized protein n=1 Tax=Favolaschia claudopus TaxID=2862362 RepID=A0AAW0CLM8_9AGAR